MPLLWREFERLIFTTTTKTPSVEVGILIDIDRDLATEMVKFTVPSLVKEIIEHGPEFIEFVKEYLMN